MDGRRVSASWSFLALAALLAVVRASPAAAAGRACSDPCLQAARAEFRDCASGAAGAFTDATDGCLERDQQCVDACRSVRQDCRDGTGASAALLLCDVERVRAEAACRDRFPLGSTRRVICIFQAQVSAFQCRRHVVRRVRHMFRDCRVEFRSCANGCRPGALPGGVQACRAEGKAAFTAALAACRLTFAVTTSACLEKDLTCFVGCGDARDACQAPTQATLDAALMACTAQQRAAVMACQAANPSGGPSLDQCVTAAQAAASTCRDKAVENAMPGSAACAQQFVQCVRGCPAASP